MRTSREKKHEIYKRRVKKIKREIERERMGSFAQPQERMSFIRKLS